MRFFVNFEKTIIKKSLNQMKNITIKALSAMLILATLGACRPEQPEIGERLAVVDGFPGSWELTGATLTDLLTPVPETKDVSRFYKNAQTTWVLTFNEDRTYTIDQKGPGPDFFGDSGTWELLDREDFPTRIRLTDANGNSRTFNLLNMPRSSDRNLGLRATREACGQPYLQYNLRFSRQ
jgi:hypothetical protein